MPPIELFIACTRSLFCPTHAFHRNPHLHVSSLLDPSSSTLYSHRSHANVQAYCLIVYRSPALINSARCLCIPSRLLSLMLTRRIRVWCALHRTAHSPGLCPFQFLVRAITCISECVFSTIEHCSLCVLQLLF
jgi:hypothetical protein